MSKTRRPTFIADTLPDKASDLIELAVKDVKNARKAGYTIDMSEWHNPEGVGRYSLNPEKERATMARSRASRRGKKFCSVCFAGSVLACSTNLKPDQRTTLDGGPVRLAKSLERKAEALNDFREGNVQDGLDALGVQLPDFIDGLSRVTVAGWDDEDPTPFYRDMLQLAKDLRRIGQ